MEINDYNIITNISAIFGIIATITGIIPNVSSLLKANRDLTYKRSETVVDNIIFPKWLRIVNLPVLVSCAVSIITFSIVVLLRNSESESLGNRIIIGAITVIIICSAGFSFILVRQNDWWKIFRKEKERLSSIALGLFSLAIGILTFCGVLGSAVSSIEDTVFASEALELTQLITPTFFILLKFFIADVIMSAYVFLITLDRKNKKFNCATIYLKSGNDITVHYDECRRIGNVVVFEVEDGSNAEKMEIEKENIIRITHSKEQ